MRNHPVPAVPALAALFLSVAFVPSLLAPVAHAAPDPPPPTLDIGSEWSTSGISNFLAVGEIAPATGLECVAVDQFGAVKLFRLTDGSSLGSIPTPFNTQTTLFFLRDLDGDGLAEMICLVPGQAPGEAYGIGRIDYDGGVQKIWGPVATAMYYYDGIEFMNLAASEPAAIAFYGGTGFFIYSPADGSLLYDSRTEVGAGWGVQSAVIDDFDDDGYEEALVEFRDANGPPYEYRMDLIGALNPATAVTGSSFGAASLFQNRPNPMAGSTRIEYDLPAEGEVRLRIFDVAGRRVRTLVDGRKGAGRHAEQWNGRDEGGAAVASGVYFYELDVEGQRSTRRLVRVR